MPPIRSWSIIPIYTITFAFLVVSARPALPQASLIDFVSRCWNVDAEASQTMVAVAFTVDHNAIPEPTSLRLTATSRNASDTAIQAAFTAARRAILMCGKLGLPIPPDTREIIITFQPEPVSD